MWNLGHFTGEGDVISAMTHSSPFQLTDTVAGKALPVRGVTVAAVSQGALGEDGREQPPEAREGILFCESKAGGQHNSYAGQGQSCHGRLL